MDNFQHLTRQQRRAQERANRKNNNRKNNNRKNNTMNNNYYTHPATLTPLENNVIVIDASGGGVHTGYLQYLNNLNKELHLNHEKHGFLRVKPNDFNPFLPQNPEYYEREIIGFENPLKIESYALDYQENKDNSLLIWNNIHFLLVDKFGNGTLVDNHREAVATIKIDDHKMYGKNYFLPLKEEYIWDLNGNPLPIL